MHLAQERQANVLRRGPELIEGRRKMLYRVANDSRSGRLIYSKIMVIVEKSGCHNVCHDHAVEVI